MSWTRLLHKQGCSDFREAESIWSLDKSLFVHPARQDKSNDSNIQETTTKKVNSSKKSTF